MNKKTFSFVSLLLLFAAQLFGALPITSLIGDYQAGVGITHGTGSLVSIWADQSGAGNNLTQSDGSMQPTDTTDSSGVAIVSFPKAPASSGFNGDRWMFSTTGSISTKTCSIWIVGRMATNASQAIVSLNNTFATAVLRQISTTTISPTLYSVSVPGNLRATNQMGLWGVANTTSASVMYTATGSHSGISPTTGSSTTGIMVGAVGGSSNPSSWMAADIQRILIYNATQSAQDVTDTRAYLISTYGLATSYTKQIVPEGDSITAGYNALASNQSYPYQLANNATIAANWRIINQGSSGATVAIMTTRQTATDALLEATGYTRQVLMVMIGKNDTSTTDGTTVYSNLVTYCNARIMAGWEVWVGTTIDTSSSTSAPRQLVLNGLIRSSIMTDCPGVTRIIDFAANAAFDPGSYSDTVYYQADGGHPTATGYGVMAGMVSPYLLASVTPSSFFFSQYRLPYVPFLLSNRVRTF